MKFYVTFFILFFSFWIPAKTLKPPTAESLLEASQAKTNKLSGKNKDCDSCKVQLSGASAMERDETINQMNLELLSLPRTPKTEKNPYGFRFRECRQMTSENVSICTPDQSNDPYRFQLYNRGPNPIVKKVKTSTGRVWEFDFEALAVQDLAMWITDFPDTTSSSTQKSYVMVFPRKVLPRLEQDGDRQTVTLPNGEKMIFNSKTHEIVGGVFKEDSPVTKGKTAQVSYHGDSVMIRADSRDSLPQLGGGKALITKGSKKCSVAKSELWPDQSENTHYHFRFSNDLDFDSFLQKKCGFGI